MQGTTRGGAATRGEARGEEAMLGESWKGEVVSNNMLSTCTRNDMMSCPCHLQTAQDGSCARAE